MCSLYNVVPSFQNVTRHFSLPVDLDLAQSPTPIGRSESKLFSISMLSIHLGVPLTINHSLIQNP